MLSRVADSMFWMNRYMERAEGLLRVLHINYLLSMDRAPYQQHSWKPVLKTFSNADEEHMKTFEQSAHKTIQYLLIDKGNHNSLKNILTKARENARGMQDHITKEVWEKVNFIYHAINNKQIEEQVLSDEGLKVINELMNYCLTYVGVTDTTMPRGMGWNFMSIGKYAERAVITVDTMYTHFESINFNIDDEKDVLYWRNLLLSVSGYELHMKTYPSTNTNSNVVHQVVLNNLFPHSIMYSLVRMEKYLQDILEENNPQQKDVIANEYGRIMSRVKYADEHFIKEITLNKFLQSLKVELLTFTHNLGKQFFSYS